MSGPPPGPTQPSTAPPPPAATPPAATTRPSNATIAWFHCFAGIAGDMALGSLIDAGADVQEIRLLLQRLSLPGWELAVEQSLRGGVACTRALVEGGGDTVARSHADIVGTVAALEVLGVDEVTASPVATGTTAPAASPENTLPSAVTSRAGGRSFTL